MPVPEERICHIWRLCFAVDCTHPRHASKLFFRRYVLEKSIIELMAARSALKLKHEMDQAHIVRTPVSQTVTVAGTPALLGKPGNRPLASISADELDRLGPWLHSRDYPMGTIFASRGERYHEVVFPERLVASVVVEFHDGRSAEVGSIGREGVIGIGGLFGGTHSDFRISTQQPGTGLAISISRLQELLPYLPGLTRTLYSAGSFFTFMAAQLSACNRLHETIERLARWYLLADDRMEQPGLRATHQSLSDLLGVRRPSISNASAQLTREGAIRYSYGKVVIADRRKLERTACDCYLELRRYLDRLYATEDTE